MAIPLSGSIGMKICPGNVACTSIAMAVDGNTTGSKSLLTLSTTAGKTSPHCMREFYGYAAISKTLTPVLLISNYTSTYQYECWQMCLCPAITSGTWTYSGGVFLETSTTLGTGSYARFRVKCNGTYVCTIGTGSAYGVYCLNTGYGGPYDYNDTLHIEVDSCVRITGGSGYSCVTHYVSPTLPSGYVVDDSQLPIVVSNIRMV